MRKMVMMMLLMIMVAVLITMMISLTMFSMVSQWDLTCFLTALHSNCRQEEKTLKMNILLWKSTETD